MTIAVHHGDCREVIPALGLMVDSVVCDPPYHLGPQRTQEIGWPSWTQNTKTARKQSAVGFMSQQWDGGDVAFDPETWRIVGSALRPGGFLLAFGGTRTHHRLACAIEDAGFVIQDCLMWLFGTGFPKRKDMLKPAFEPIVMAYKPGGKRELMIDECRIPTAPDDARAMERCNTPRSSSQYASTPPIGTFIRSKASPPLDTGAGRWPANVCHDDSDEVVELFPDSAGQSGVVTGLEPSASTHSIYGGGLRRQPSSPRGDSGSAARFFFSAKAGAQDRWGSRHPTVKPVELMKWLVALVTPVSGIVLDPFAGSGTTGVAALETGRNAILIEREAQYIADIRERLAFYEGGGTHSVQAKNRNRTVDHGPLFAKAAE